MFFRHYLARTFARKGHAAAILAGLCALAFAAEPVCVESEAVCVDTADRVIARDRRRHRLEALLAL